MENVPGKTTGLCVSECGQIGVSAKTLVKGKRTGPPAERLYAVEPVGVETITPSP